MARKPKLTLEYITLDCVDKTTLKRLERKFGAKGRLFWYELLRLIGRSEGYLIDLSDEWNLEDVLLGELYVKKEEGIEILNALSDWGNIDQNTWKEYRIIWCQDLIDRHSDLWRKRKKIPVNPFKKDRNDTTSTQKYTSSVQNNTTSVVKEAGMQQSKVKESKVKERKDDVDTSLQSVVVTIDSNIQNYLKNKKLIQAVLKSQKISEKELRENLEKFKIHLSERGILTKETLDFRTHFISWLKIQIKKTTKNGGQGKNTNFD